MGPALPRVTAGRASPKPRFPARWSPQGLEADPGWWAVEGSAEGSARSRRSQALRVGLCTAWTGLWPHPWSSVSRLGTGGVVWTHCLSRGPRLRGGKDEQGTQLPLHRSLPGAGVFSPVSGACWFPRPTPGVSPPRGSCWACGSFPGALSLSLFHGGLGPATPCSPRQKPCSHGHLGREPQRRCWGALGTQGGRVLGGWSPALPQPGSHRLVWELGTWFPIRVLAE